MAKLFLISTPIGNIEDITIRALKTLFSVKLIACENPRETQKIIDYYADQYEQKDREIDLISYNDHSRHHQIPKILATLQAGDNVALVSDRGTPVIADPGYKLAQEIIRVGEYDGNIQLDVIPGANALLPALQLSGFPPDKFYFAGFLPRKSGKRKNFLTELPSVTIICYESPHRLIKSLTDAQEVFPDDTEIAVCFELTKRYQRVFRGIISNVIEEISNQPIKGEITIVINNN